MLAPKEVKLKLNSPMVAGTFADLEAAMRDLCRQIDTLTHHLLDEEDRAYTELAKENLWQMYHNAHKHALARTGIAR